MRRPAAVKARPVDIQESLKILQFRFARKVGFQPAVVRRGVRYYPIDGEGRAESELVSFAGSALSSHCH